LDDDGDSAADGGATIATWTYFSVIGVIGLILLGFCIFGGQVSVHDVTNG
jgi:hypothetical protein